MTDDVAEKRMAVYKAYSGDGWKDKVNKMSDAQVVAVYFRLKDQKKI